jgi:hypothetical protein
MDAIVRLNTRHTVALTRLWDTLASPLRRFVTPDLRDWIQLLGVLLQLHRSIGLSLAAAATSSPSASAVMDVGDSLLPHLGDLLRVYILFGLHGEERVQALALSLEGEADAWTLLDVREDSLSLSAAVVDESVSPAPAPAPASAPSSSSSTLSSSSSPSPFSSLSLLLSVPLQFPSSFLPLWLSLPPPAHPQGDVSRVIVAHLMGYVMAALAKEKDALAAKVRRERGRE